MGDWKSRIWAVRIILDFFPKRYQNDFVFFCTYEGNDGDTKKKSTISCTLWVELLSQTKIYHKRVIQDGRNAWLVFQPAAKDKKAAPFIFRKMWDQSAFLLFIRLFCMSTLKPQSFAKRMLGMTSIIIRQARHYPSWFALVWAQMPVTEGEQIRNGSLPWDSCRQLAGQLHP